LKLIRKIELVANLAIIVVAILLGIVLVRSYLWPTAKEAGPKAPPVNLVGRKLSLPDMDWSKSERTLVLILQANCRFCTESAPFYRELSKRQATQSKLNLIAVLPNPIDDAKSYLGSMGVTVSEIRQAPLSSIGASGTPTLVMVDSSGVVTDAWKGRLDGTGEAEVLSRF
jgi:hypothetical protein